MKRALPRALLLLLSIALVPSLAMAQRTLVTITGHPLDAAAPTGADFAAGSILAGSNGYTVEVDTGNQWRTTILAVRCGTPCPATGTKAVGTVEWQRSGTATWTPLTTANVTVDSKLMIPGWINDPWTGTIAWRFKLDWLTDVPSATQNRYNVVYTITVTVH